jgi:hypothetical protein
MTGNRRFAWEIHERRSRLQTNLSAIGCKTFLYSLCKSADFNDSSGMRAFLFPAILGLSCLVSSVPAQSPTAPSPIVADILKLSRAKMKEEVIVAYAQKAPPGKVSAGDLLTLHSNGISSQVLLALMDSHTASDPAQATASDVPPTVSDQAPIQAVAEDPATAGPVVTASASAPIVEAPLVNYVSTPVYVGAGSIYYPDYAWSGFGWSWGYVGWSSWYPWYGYGCYPYYGYSGYYAHHYHHDHHHHGHGHHGHHATSGGHRGRSTVAAAGRSQSGVRSTASEGRSGVATARPQLGGNRAVAGAASGNLSSRSPANTTTRSQASTLSRGNATPRSTAPTGNARSTTATIGQTGNARAGVGVTPARAANRPMTASRIGQPSTTTATRSFARPASSSVSPARPVSPGNTGRTALSSGYHGGQRAGSANVGRGNFAAPRSYAAPSSMGRYSAARSSGGGASMRSFSGGGSRAISGGGGGVRGGGFSGGGRSGGGGRR